MSRHETCAIERLFAHIFMSRNTSTRTRGRAAAGRIGVRTFARTTWAPLARSLQASNRRRCQEWESAPDESLDSMLSSALAAQDKELARILNELDKISKTLKSGAPNTRTLAQTLKRTVTCAVKQSLLDRELRSLALTDDLTCLYNRRAFLALAAQQLKVARRKAQGLLLFFADVNNLKEINDTYGHREGDFALVRVADALEKTFRNSDVIARLAGDEFAVLALEAA